MVPPELLIILLHPTRANTIGAAACGREVVLEQWWRVTAYRMCKIGTYGFKLCRQFDNLCQSSGRRFRGEDAVISSRNQPQALRFQRGYQQINERRV